MVYLSVRLATAYHEKNRNARVVIHSEIHREIHREYLNRKILKGIS